MTPRPAARPACRLHGDRDAPALHRPDAALTALVRQNEHGEPVDATTQLHMLAALAATVRADQERVCALAREREQLQRALESRDIIGQAKGMLMNRRRHRPRLTSPS